MIRQMMKSTAIAAMAIGASVATAAAQASMTKMAPGAMANMEVSTPEFVKMAAQ